MEDSNLWYYIVLGAIYLLSKVFGKKKKAEPVEREPEVEAAEFPVTQDYAPDPKPKKAPVTFEDIFKELTGEIKKPFEEAFPKLEIEQQEVEEIEQPVLATGLIDYQKANIESVRPDEEIGIPGYTPVQREKPKFERSENYRISKKKNEIRDGVVDLLADHTGLQQAFVLKEVLDRKY